MVSLEIHELDNSIAEFIEKRVSAVTADICDPVAIEAGRTAIRRVLLGRQKHLSEQYDRVQQLISSKV